MGDEASGKTGSGKKFYHNIIPGSSVKAEPFYVAIITPVIHYCMGGLEIDADGAVLNNSGKSIKGLYCAGEVAGGVHGNNRLGGNSLLDCVVFGRVTGQAATKYILGGDVKKVDLTELTGGGLSGEVKAINEPFMDLTYMVYQLKYDSVHGRFPGTIETKTTDGKDFLIVDGTEIA